ncbi:MAG: hypothetical protein WC847_01450 [Candidatus Paceibacterota bacterium]|jgi:hypothetical protein
MKKLILYIIIFVAFAGFLSPVGKANAQAAIVLCTSTNPNVPANCIPPNTQGTCIVTNLNVQTGVSTVSKATDTAGHCVGIHGDFSPGAIDASLPATAESKNTEKTALEKLVGEKSCTSLGGGGPEGCLIVVSFFVFFTVPSFILTVTAKLFNAMASITLSSKLFTASTFVPSGWAVVRDLSNLFFILVLLYIAIKMILGLGGSEAKKMIAKVIITAFLINFSMFFTQVVIDSSNVLALIFYNKMDVQTKNPDGSERYYIPVTKGERDISGGIAKAFNPSQFLTESFFERAKQKTSGLPPVYLLASPAVYGVAALYGNWNPQKEVPTSMILGIILISGLIMSFAAYAFLWAALAFVSRLIELWVLIIFSPFAFVSFSVPILNKVPYIGWEEWSKRLIKMSFMAPIFMFFMYLIFMLVKADLFGNLSPAGSDADVGSIEKIILVSISALVLLILLMKATKFAKEGSGQLGEIAMKGMKMAGGLALAAATGGTAMLATGAIGSLAAKAASSKFLNDKQKDTGFGGMAARMALKTANYGTKASFDLRKLPGMAGLSKATGINMETGKGIGLGIKEGGYEKRRKDKEEKELKRAKELEVKEGEPLKQALNKTEANLQSLIGASEEELETLDKTIEKNKEKVATANSRLTAAKGTAGEDDARDELYKANDALENAKAEKTALREGKIANVQVSGAAGIIITPTGTDYRTRTTTGTAGGPSIKDLEDQKKIDTKALKTENRQRQWAAADRLEKKSFWGNTNRATAHKIRMNAKVEEKAH